MDKNSILKQKLQALQHRIDPKYAALTVSFINHYKQAVGDAFTHSLPTILLFIQFVEEQCLKPYSFQPYHQKITAPIDYYEFSLAFINPLVDLPNSKVLGIEHFEKLLPLLKQKENIVLLANHQTESDPQAISILLGDIGRQIIYVAGERVLTDPLAIPFSMGCDLLCVYSKRYIDHPPQLKSQKQLHNKHTMEIMSSLLKEGGKIIYVAPSGGRDRKGADGKIEVAPFDPSSIEMFHLMAKKAQTKTHFIPLALRTYNILPPPETIQKELGETRIVKKAPIFLSFAPEFPMDTFYSANKFEQRQKRAEAVWLIVKTLHDKLGFL
jgi:glycerol-3-phosphate O-acyltransferase